MNIGFSSVPLSELHRFGSSSMPLREAQCRCGSRHFESDTPARGHLAAGYTLPQGLLIVWIRHWVSLASPPGASTIKHFDPMFYCVYSKCMPMPFRKARSRSGRSQKYTVLSGTAPSQQKTWADQHAPKAHSAYGPPRPGPAGLSCGFALHVFIQCRGKSTARYVGICAAPSGPTFTE